MKWITTEGPERALLNKNPKLEDLRTVFLFWVKMVVFWQPRKGRLENRAGIFADLYSGHNIPKFSSTYCDDTELDPRVYDL